MLSIIPDINQEKCVENMKTVISLLECYPGKEKVQVEFFDDKYSVYELKQKVEIDTDLLEILYALEGIEVILE